MSKLYVTSDQHFFHENIIKYCNRPFKTPQEMNETLVQNYNNTVTSSDMCIHLGDLACGYRGKNKELKKILTSLHGQKILIKGNHDSESDKFYKDCGFETIGEYMTLGSIFLCHYGFSQNEYTSQKENAMKKIFLESGCTSIIHGHTHQNYIESNEINGLWKRVNVAVDVTDFKPLELKTL